jgi:hypothetical protein
MRSYSVATATNQIRQFIDAGAGTGTKGVQEDQKRRTAVIERNHAIHRPRSARPTSVARAIRMSL